MAGITHPGRAAFLGSVMSSKVETFLSADEQQQCSEPEITGDSSTSLEMTGERGQSRRSSSQAIRYASSRRSMISPGRLRICSVMGRQQTLQSSTSDCSPNEVSTRSGKASPQCGQTTVVSTSNSIRRAHPIPPAWSPAPDRLCGNGADPRAGRPFAKS